MSVKRILIALGVVLVIVLIPVVYQMLNSGNTTEKKVNKFLTEGAIKQIVLNTEIYYDENGTVPQSLTELYSFSPSLSLNTPGISSIEYRYIDSKNAEVCPISDKSKCKRFTGK